MEALANFQSSEFPESNIQDLQEPSYPTYARSNSVIYDYEQVKEIANDLPEANSDMAGGTDVKDVDHSQVTYGRFIWGILALSVFGCAFFFFKKRNRF